MGSKSAASNRFSADEEPLKGTDIASYMSINEEEERESSELLIYEHVTVGVENDLFTQRCNSDHSSTGRLSAGNELRRSFSHCGAAMTSSIRLKND